MKILSAKMEVNQETFAPEMIITMSFPMELVKEGVLEVSKMQFIFAEFEQAWREYNERL